MPADFKSEKEMCNYIEDNIEDFCNEIFEQPLISYKRESYLGLKRFGGNTPRVDFDLTLDNRRILLECKNPNQVYAEMSKSISQLLVYSTMVKDSCELVLVTSATLPIIQQTILKYELPIRVVFLTKSILADWNLEIEKKVIAGEIQVKDQYAIS